MENEVLAVSFLKHAIGQRDSIPNWRGYRHILRRKKKSVAYVRLVDLSGGTKNESALLQKGRREGEDEAGDRE